MRRIQRTILTGLIVSLAVALGGCASTGEGSGEEAAMSVPVPASSKLARIEVGMSEQQVRKAIGEPDDIRIYPTGKIWIPFYFGGDTMHSDWTYSGVGKIVFSNPSRWTQTMKVIERHHNPGQS